jgi:transcriptional regulator of acetoin/glycerol metabolism
MLQWPETLPTRDELEDELLREAMRRAGNAQQAAALIGIGKTTFYRRWNAMQTPTQL